MRISAAGWRLPRRGQRSAASASISLAQTSIDGALLWLLKEFFNGNAGLGRELVRQGRALSAAIVHFSPGEAVKGKETHVGRGGSPALHHLRKFVKSLQAPPPQAGPRRR